MSNDTETSGADTHRIKVADFALPLLCGMVYLAWSCALPIDLAPDEYMRLPIPFFILSNHCLPVGNEPELINEIWGISYAYFPYGSSLLGLFFMKIASLFTADYAWLVRAVRLGSVIPACGSVFVCEQIGKRLFRYRISPYLFALVVALLPQAAFCASYLNNEALMVFSISLIVHAWLVGTASGWKPRQEVYLGVALGICALSYYFAYGYILASIVVFAVTIYRGRTSSPNLARFAKGALLVFCVAFAIGGWFFVRNAALHHGDLFGMKASHKLAEQYAIDGFRPSEHISPDDEGLTMLDTLLVDYHGTVWWKATTLSAIGRFGYLNVNLEAWTYAAYIAFFALGLTLSLPGLFTMAPEKRFIFLVFFGLRLFALAMSLYYSWASDYQAQGRYLASALIPFAAYVTLGYEWLVRALEWTLSHLIVTSQPAAKRSGHLEEPTPEAAATKATSYAHAALVITCAVYVALFVYVALTVIVPSCTQGIMWSAA